MAKTIKIVRQPKKVQGFTEVINGVELDMILIPPGSFTMGAEKGEELSNNDERPTHRVTIAKQFFMGRYPITQGQWRALANFKPVKREFKKENPSIFEGSNKLPVEGISWHDAVEFCARLSKQTGKNYHLPSEAQWEYACRAGTTTPFHFGETISTEVANYKGTHEKYGAYGRGEKGEYRGKTTEVDYFDNANEFGLSDMHGNVWEWCADPWHEDYNNAPDDGSVWDEKAEDDRYQNYLENIDILFAISNFRLLRGGSWYGGSNACRSAYRSKNFAYLNAKDYGFRVVCG